MKIINLKQYVTKQLDKKFNPHKYNKKVFIKSRRQGFSYISALNILIGNRSKIKEALKKYKFY
jgi:hypothetical protein